MKIPDKVLNTWQQLCLESEARIATKGFFPKKFIESKYKNWTITLDLYSLKTDDPLDENWSINHYFTRFRAPYQSIKDIRLSAYRKGFFSLIGKLFKMQDIVTGFEEFDDTYILQGSDREIIQEIFENKLIRKILLRQQGVRLFIEKGKSKLRIGGPKNNYLIRVEFLGAIDELNKLKDIIKLIETILDQLVQVGIAESTMP